MSQKNNTAWYRSVPLRLLAGLVIGTLLIQGVAFMINRNAVIRDRVKARINEISRYAVTVASDISVNRYVTGAAVTDYSEVDSMSGFFPETRILVLNVRGRVVKDSASTRRGRTMLNDTILTAMSGSSVTETEGRYVRIAVPVFEYKTTDVVGVVYVSFGLDRQYETARTSMESNLLTMIIAEILILALMIPAILSAFRPLDGISKWLKNVQNGHFARKPATRANEYGDIVQTMDSIISTLREEDQSRKEFVSNVSHELKTPMSSIKVLTESLLLAGDASVEEYREFLQDINTEVDRESTLINDLLSLTRLEDNKSGLNLSMVSMNDLAEVLLKRLQPLADARRIALVLENHTAVEAEVDEMKMSVALSNLIENAIKYNVEEGSVRVGVNADLSDAILTVSDTGIGIPEEDIPKIFQRFYRVDKTRDRATGGTGLGLSIVHKIVTMHHGTISVSSKLNEGTTFTVRIPLIAPRVPSDDAVSADGSGREVKR